MIDDRPSIAELKAAVARGTFTDEESIILAAPVLLEIAAAALAIRRPIGATLLVKSYR